MAVRAYRFTQPGFHDGSMRSPGFVAYIEETKKGLHMKLAEQALQPKDTAIAAGPVVILNRADRSVPVLTVADEPIGPDGILHFKMSGIAPGDSYLVTFTDGAGKTVVVEGETNDAEMTADLSSLTDGSVTSSIKVNRADKGIPALDSADERAAEIAEHARMRAKAEGTHTGAVVTELPDRIKIGDKGGFIAKPSAVLIRKLEAAGFRVERWPEGKRGISGWCCIGPDIAGRPVVLDLELLAVANDPVAEMKDEADRQERLAPTPPKPVAQNPPKPAKP